MLEHVELTSSQVEIRKRARQARALLTAKERSVASHKICERISQSRTFRSAQDIACYIPMRTEVDIWQLIERAHAQNKRVFAPVTQENFKMLFREISPGVTLTTNQTGLHEPVDGAEVDPRNLDMVITPLVAFDDNRNRVGMGGGYYDRAFAFLSDPDSKKRPVLVGAAFECQRVQKIAPNPWDIPLFRIITESRTY